MTTPKRIASLISSATEMLYLLGLGERVVGVSHECDFPPEVHAKPRLTRSLVEATAASGEIDAQVRSLAAEQSALYAIDVDKLAELAPDLIVTQAQCDVCAVRYEDVVAAVRERPSLAESQVLALNPAHLADVFDDIRRIGKAAGVEATAADVVAGLQARVDRVRSTTADLSAGEVPRVACLEWIEPPMLAANWMPELIAWAGGRCPLVVAGQHSTYADWEQIVRFDPQVIVVMPCGFDLERTVAEAAPLAAFPKWQTLSAVRDHRVFAVDGNAYFNRSGPRLVDSLEILAHLFHPERFEPPIAPHPWCRLVERDGSLAAEES
ncbi:MAG: cobalamin-binding protein [Planctomycetota bacterium]|nr:MAG: cobalamin-binding protein [Planctomycetota bacterium]